MNTSSHSGFVGVHLRKERYLDEQQVVPAIHAICVHHDPPPLGPLSSQLPNHQRPCSLLRGWCGTPAIKRTYSRPNSPKLERFAPSGRTHMTSPMWLLLGPPIPPGTVANAVNSSVLRPRGLVDCGNERTCISHCPDDVLRPQAWLPPTVTASAAPPARDVQG